MPWTAAAFTTFAFAMIGIPPTGGFFSKLYLILGAIDAGQWVFVFVIVLSSVLALTYLMNVIRYMYFATPASPAPPADLRKPEPGQPLPASMLVPMLVTAVGIVLLGLFNGEIVARFIDPVIPASLVR